MHGAAGGVGTAAVQLGRAAGARVTATVRREEARAEVERLGAESALDPDGFEERGPFDVVLELVGAPNFAANLKALETGGRIVVIGVGGGPKVEEFNLLALMGKRARVMGSTLRARPLEEKAVVTRCVERRVLPSLESGAVEVPLAATFPLDRVADAYDHFEAGGKLGKIVIEIG